MEYLEKIFQRLLLACQLADRNRHCTASDDVCASVWDF